MAVTISPPSLRKQGFKLKQLFLTATKGEAHSEKRVLEKFLYIGERLGYIPYRYDRSSDQIVFETSRRRTWIFMGHVTLILGYESMLLVRYATILASDRSNMHDRVIGAFYPALYIALNLNHVITWKWWGYTQLIVNETDTVVTNIKAAAQNMGAAAKAASSSAFRIIVSVGLFTCLSSGALRGLKVLLKPSSPELVSSMFASSASEMGMGLRVVLAILQFNVTCFQGYSGALHGLLIAYYSQNVIMASGFLRHLGSSPLYLEQERSLRRIYRGYFKLRALETVVRDAYGTYPLMVEVCLVTMVIVRLFLVLAFHDLKNLIGAASVLLSLLMFFKFLAAVNENSAKMISTWSGIPSSWFQRFRRSVQPIRVSVGGFYFADSQLILTILSIIVTSTVSLFLAYSN